MRYGTNKEKIMKLGEGLIKMIGKGELWHTKEEEEKKYCDVCDVFKVVNNNNTHIYNAHNVER